VLHYYETAGLEGWVWWVIFQFQVTMDITRGSLDKISRPASGSRAYPICRSLNTSMDLLTPEPRLPKVILFAFSGLKNSVPNSS